MLSSRPSNSASASSSLPWSRRSSASATGVVVRRAGHGLEDEVVGAHEHLLGLAPAPEVAQQGGAHAVAVAGQEQAAGRASRSMMPRRRKVVLHDATRSKSAV